MQSLAKDGLRSRFKALLRSAEVDRAVFYAALSRLWQMGSGTVTNLLIIYAFSSELQGFYYTFASLLAMQTIAELGLHWIIVHAASHEWAGLSMDASGNIAGDEVCRSRLADLFRATRRWFFASASLFTVCVLLIGVAFFQQRPVDVSWTLPWMLSCALCGLSLSLTPAIATLEGCDQMASVNRFRFFQFVGGSIGVWVGILLGLGLWVVPLGFAIRLAIESYLVLRVYGRFSKSLINTKITHRIEWRKEIWPLQWRAAVQAPAQYLGFQTVTPILFHYHGATAAGVMGLTWTVMNVLQQGAFVWMQSRAPRFGVLIAQRNRQELRRLFLRVTMISSGVLLASMTAFLAALVVANQADHWIAERLAARLLDPTTATVFALAVLVGHIPQCLNIYVRSHRQAPLFGLFLFANLVTAAGVWAGGSRWGAIGAGVAMLSVAVLIRLPGSLLVLREFRRRYTAEEHPAQHPPTED